MALRILENNIFEYDDDEMDELNLIFYGVPRQVLERVDYFNKFDELTFFRRFRVTKHTALYILSLIEAEIEYPYDVNNSVAPMNQLLMFLRLCATGSYLSCVGDFAGVHVSTVSRHGKRVARALARLGSRFIKMPNTPDEIATAQHGFYQIARFPRVIGVVDGTHIKIKSPGGNDAEVFRNRKGYFSINVQTVSDSKLKICDLVVRWPGSVHDVTIFNNSRIRHNFETNRYQNSILLGDSGYNLRGYLLTPLLNPTTRAEILYNESLIRTRNTVERQIGVWKMRFPILAYGCRLKLDTAMVVIVATGVLHNICIENNDPEPPPPEDVELLHNIMIQDEVPNIPPQNQNNILDVQRNLIANYFAHIEE